MLKSCLRLRRSKRTTKGEQLQWKSNAVIEFFRGEEVVLRVDLPLVVEEDGDGPYPLLASHNRDYDPEIVFDGIRVNTRHRALDEL